MGWQQDRNDEVVAAYGEGRPVAELEREYGMTRAEIEYLVAGVQAQPRRHESGLRNKGNRILLGVGTGFVVQIFAGLLGADFSVRVGVWAAVAAVTYALVGR